MISWVGWPASQPATSQPNDLWTRKSSEGAKKYTFQFGMGLKTPMELLPKTNCQSLSWVEMVSWLHWSLNNDFPISLSISRGTVFCREHYIRDRHDTHESVQWLIFDVVKKYILGPILGKVPTSSIVLPFLQIISCFSFSRYIKLAIRLHIYFVQIHGKKIYVENAKTTYNLE